MKFKMKRGRENIKNELKVFNALVCEEDYFYLLIDTRHAYLLFMTRTL